VRQESEQSNQAQTGQPNENKLTTQDFKPSQAEKIFNANRRHLNPSPRKKEALRAEGPKKCDPQAPIRQHIEQCVREQRDKGEKEEPPARSLKEVSQWEKQKRD
jgi:hypothetical protein